MSLGRHLSKDENGIWCIYKVVYVGKIDVRSGKKNGSTSLENDNMCYVSFRIREQECVPWCSEIQNQRLEVFG